MFVILLTGWGDFSLSRRAVDTDDLQGIVGSTGQEGGHARGRFPAV